MSLQLVLDVILGITPVPGLSAAFNTLKLVVSSIQQARETRSQLEELAYAVAQPPETLNAEFSASRLGFVQEEQERPFLKALFTQDSRILGIEGFYRRINTVASAFQISALLNIQRILSIDDRAGSQKLERFNARLTTMELNQMHLLQTVGFNPAISASIHRNHGRSRHSTCSNIRLQWVVPNRSPNRIYPFRLTQ
ncbi:hypothetical protein DFH09DRAFT_1379401 [Mycena vulgaris]|nr:hypothetical protein DFH09DRAFT_1379401 [Mycena vulgaris]